MPLKTYDTQDAVPPEQRETAIETADGKFIVEEPVAIDTTAQATILKIREEKKRIEKEKKELEEKLAEMETAAEAKAQGASEDVLNKIRENAKKEKKELEDKNLALEATIQRMAFTTELKGLALKHGIMEERLDDAMMTLERRTEPGKDGTGHIVKDAKGNPVADDLDTFVSKTLKAEKPWLYKGTGSSGSGSGGSEGGGSGGDAEAKARAEGKAAATEQKKSAAENKLAFL